MATFPGTPRLQPAGGQAALGRLCGGSGQPRSPQEGPALPQLLMRPDLRGTRTQWRLPPHRQKLTRLKQSSQSPSHHLIPGPSHKTSIGTHGGNHTPHPSVPGRSPPAAEGLRLGPGEGRLCPASPLTPLAQPRPAVDPALHHRKGRCRNQRTQSRGQRERKPPRASPSAPDPRGRWPWRRRPLGDPPETGFCPGRFALRGEFPLTLQRSDRRFQEVTRGRKQSGRCGRALL